MDVTVPLESLDRALQRGLDRLPPGDEYDLDAVCRRDYVLGSISQAALKDDVGIGLEQFCKTGPDGSPERDDEGRRCWTLKYPGEHFHLDVLPAVPDPKKEPNGIRLTDTAQIAWLQSNPKDFTLWFRRVMADELAERIMVLSKHMDVDKVPRG